MNARKLTIAIAVTCGSLLTLASSHPARAQEQKSVPHDRVEDIRLTIDWHGGKPTPYIEHEVDEAIEKTLRLAIFDQLGASISTLTSNLDQVTATFKNVINIVLERKGMHLETITLTPGPVTSAHLTIQLASDKIESFRVHFRFRRSTPFLDAITSDEQNALTSNLTGEFKGTPFSDRDWIERLVRRRVEEVFQMSTAYADFDLLVLVIPDTTTEVYVTFLSRNNTATIARYFLKLRSETMLNLQLAEIGTSVDNHLEDLRGLPISFVAAKARTIENFIEREVEQLHGLAMMLPIAHSELYLVRNDISFVLWVNSQRWRTMLTGRVDFNREGDSARFDLKAGLRFAHSFDVFFQSTLLPGNLELRPQLGVAGHGGKYGFIEAAYDFKLNSMLCRAQLNLLPDFYLSAERYTKRKLKQEDEYSFTYIYRNAYEFKIISDLKGEVFGAVAVRI
ncbi:MAG: hypothetical protein B1H03_04360 [Planctomycetales bacterium 4484_113]|nr:MAG: hypothetical protein B1H03_04360 [Planctomycetales bacterium 4484_113]